MQMRFTDEERHSTSRQLMDDWRQQVDDDEIHTFFENIKINSNNNTKIKRLVFLNKIKLKKLYICNWTFSQLKKNQTN